MKHGQLVVDSWQRQYRSPRRSNRQCRYQPPWLWCGQDVNGGLFDVGVGADGVRFHGDVLEHQFVQFCGQKSRPSKFSEIGRCVPRPCKSSVRHGVEPPTRCAQTAKRSS